jgi:putative solute:sodium symporter small subunit
MPALPLQAPDARAIYWRRTLRLTAGLLLLWFAVTFGVTFFARDLDFDFFGWPFSFWVAGQGALLVYLVIVGVYALAMDRLDGLALAALAERDEPPAS